MQQTSLADIALSASMEATATELTIRYLVFNRGTDDLYLFNQLYDFYDGSPGYRVEPDLAVIEYCDDVVVISKKLVQVPDDIDVEYPNVPCMKRLEPGMQSDETFRLKLPLQRRTPYEQGTGARPGLRAARFQLGYFFGKAAARATAMSVETSVGPLLHFGSFSAQHQLLIDVGPFEPVPTLED